MSETTKIYNVKNRSAGMVVYKIPELNIRREFAPGETKKISFDELEKLSFISGGRALMASYLQIQSVEATEDLGIHTEPEYNMSEQDIITLINEGSLDEFLDCLDFAPQGVIDLIKKIAVELPMNSLEKRRALKEKTGFDVTTALAHVEEEIEEENASKQEAAASAPVRRVQKNVTVSPGRRTAPKYTVVEE